MTHKLYLKFSEFSTPFLGPSVEGSFFKRRASYHFKAQEFRNFREFNYGRNYILNQTWSSEIKKKLYLICCY